MAATHEHIARVMARYGFKFETVLSIFSPPQAQDRLKTRLPRGRSGLYLRNQTDHQH